MAAFGAEAGWAGVQAVGKGSWRGQGSFCELERKVNLIWLLPWLLLLPFVRLPPEAFLHPGLGLCR